MFLPISTSIIVSRHGEYAWLVKAMLSRYVLTVHACMTLCRIKDMEFLHVSSRCVVRFSWLSKSPDCFPSLHAWPAVATNSCSARPHFVLGKRLGVESPESFL